MQETARGPLPVCDSPEVDDLYQVCPGVDIDYPGLNQFVFGQMPSSWLVGNYRDFYIGHSLVPEIRHQGASGGIITQVLVYLLEDDLIDGAVVLRHGWPKPWLSAPIIATTVEEIADASQSVYVPTPVNTILTEMDKFKGRLAYVGLPDQVAALRELQRQGHSGANKVEYVLGPYVGTALYLAAIESYLRSNGISSLEEIERLRYRDGEWPGYLSIKLRSGEELKAEKFYYNYLIPFFITQATLYSVDFTNELTDISVGDAWRPDLESKGGGHSVIVSRTEKGADLLAALRRERLLTLEKITPEEAIKMHAHMIDFKKRGAFIRLKRRQSSGKPVPSYGYRPSSTSIARQIIEVVISLLFAIGRTKISRWLVERIPLRTLGPIFNGLRKSWKRISKPAKRKDLGETPFEVIHGA